MDALLKTAAIVIVAIAGEQSGASSEDPAVSADLTAQAVDPGNDSIGSGSCTEPWLTREE